VDDYPDRYKPVARRLIEVFAAFLASADAHSRPGVPRSLGDLRKMTYTRTHVTMPESSVANLKNTS